MLFFLGLYLNILFQSNRILESAENEKLVLDQYTMKGGKSLWLIDAVAMEKDSLYNESGKSYAIARELNLTDFFLQELPYLTFRGNPIIHRPSRQFKNNS